MCIILRKNKGRTSQDEEKNGPWIPTVMNFGRKWKTWGGDVHGNS